MVVVVLLFVWVTVQILVLLVKRNVMFGDKCNDSCFGGRKDNVLVSYTECEGCGGFGSSVCTVDGGGGSEDDRGDNGGGDHS